MQTLGIRLGVMDFTRIDLTHLKAELNPRYQLQ